MEHSGPAAQGVRMPGGRCWWADKHLTPLTSAPVSLSLSLVVRGPRTSSVPRVGSQDRKLPNFFPTWPSFVLADGRGHLSRYISQTGIWRETGGGGVGLSPTRSQLWKPTADNYTLRHTGRRQSSQLPVAQPGGAWAAREAGRRSPHPAVPSHPAVPGFGFVGAAVTHLPKGQGQRRPRKSWNCPKHKACRRRCEGGLPPTPPWSAYSYTLGTHSHTLGLTPRAAQR